MIGARPALLGLLIALALLAAACGADTDDAVTDTDDPTPTASTPPESTPTPEPTPAPTAAPTPAPTVPSDPLLIDTTLGPVRGFEIGEVRAWTAIPFGADTSGVNRWRAPQPHEAWSEPLDASAEGLMCPQGSGGAAGAFLVSPPQDEDCLTLSVWSPADAAGAPTMVWIHGGGLTAGSAHQPLYDGDHLAARGVVVIGINYRLGALGFMAHPELADEDPEGRTGNYGIMDQQLALQWVQDNAAAFGGDPGNVTLFGESAGGFSICGHLASAESAALFHKAIIQSGAGCHDLLSRGEAFEATAEFVAGTPCAGQPAELECLRSIGPDSLLTDAAPSELVADGVVLDTAAIERARAGDLNDVVLMTGSNLDEMTLFTIGAEEPSPDDLVDAAAPFVGDDAASEIVALYDPADYESNLARLQTLLNDAVFACPAQAFAQTGAAAGAVVYRYHYTFVNDPDPFGLGATHGAELPVLFANPDGIAGLPPELTADAAALSVELQRAWTSFAADGVPLAPEGDWAPTDDEAPLIMQIDREWTAQTEIRGGRCAPLIAAAAG